MSLAVLDDEELSKWRFLWQRDVSKNVTHELRCAKQNKLGL